jgi:hypothetical protein
VVSIASFLLTSSKQEQIRVLTEKLEKEARQHRSETQLLREQLELALRLNTGDFQAISI